MFRDEMMCAIPKLKDSYHLILQKFDKNEKHFDYTQLIRSKFDELFRSFRECTPR